jgi:mono/diheme cytochrome c family protein
VICAPVLPASAADVPAGEQIFREKCASCHGAAGEGTKKHKEPLIGERPPPELAKVIAQTMPENKPGSLSAAEAERVAAYIHDAFYSVAARERNKPPRIELARLTVRQYRNAVADLIGSFRPASKADPQHGLKAEYFKNRRFRGGDRVLERIDPEVRFDFGTDTPVPEKTEPHEFSIRWNGSVLAPETGQYEFLIRTEHAARLWLNDLNRPLIDAWVKSGNDTEYRGSIFLVAGRSYALRLEYSKAKQGVDDSDKQKTKPKPVKSSIALLWKPPHLAADVVPSRNLAPSTVSESFALATPFPPDDRSYGWERGTSVSREWDEAATEAALETAGYVVSKLNELAGTRDGDPDRKAKARDFCRRFAERAFRRPLTDDQKQLYVERQFEAAGDVDVAVKRVLLLVLKSPRFLYREVGSKPDGYDVAARLSFGLWDSLPDAELLAAAAAGQLATREQVARQAERMLSDPRARTKLREFLLTWLKVDHYPDIAKDPKRYPGFDAAVVADLRTSLELFLDEIVWSERSDFRQLLLADSLQLNGRLAKLYGADLPADAGFETVKLDPEQRAGVLTHPYIMAAFAYTGESSPIHRGVFLLRGVLGVALRPPPDAFTPLPADLHPDLTTRERVTLQTKHTNCMACHGVINPLGFPLEHFDAIGRFRDKDNGKPINAAGSYQSRAGKTVSLTGARSLAEFLAGSAEVQEAFAEKLFHHLVQQSVKAYGPQTPAELRRSFAANDFHMRKLAIEVMAVSSLTARPEDVAELLPPPKVGEPPGQ